MTKPWDDARFTCMAESYGGSISRWPLEERETATEYATSSLVAGKALRRELTLDNALDSVTAFTPRKAFLSTLYVLPATKWASPPYPGRPFGLWAGGAAFAASLLIGFMLGSMHISQLQTSGDRYMHGVIFGNPAAEYLYE